MKNNRSVFGIGFVLFALVVLWAVWHAGFFG